jgi:hypothetical protein
MKGIYLTKEGKKEIEAKIAYLEKWIQAENDCENPLEYLLGEWKGKNIIYKEILSSAIILPVEESWGSTKLYSHSTPISISKDYPNGVIINNDVK